MESLAVEAIIISQFNDYHLTEGSSATQRVGNNMAEGQTSKQAQKYSRKLI